MDQRLEMINFTNLRGLIFLGRMAGGSKVLKYVEE